MISNREPSNNLAKEILKKKKEMQANDDKEKKRKLIAYACIGLLAALMIGFAVYDLTGGEESEITDFATPQTDNDKYNTKLEALEAKEKSGRNSNLLDVFSQKEEDTVAVDTLAEEGLKKQLEALDAPKKTARKGGAPQKKEDDVYGDYSMWEEEGDKQNKSGDIDRATGDNTLSYQEKLQLAKQARYGKTGKNNAPSVTVKETRVAIFRDQFLLPGQLVELVLTKDFTHNNKLFKKGTPVYGYININKTRVLFDIKNIAHEPLDIEVRDIRDGLVGMYSSRAGELWKKYEAEGINSTTESAVGEITGSGILSNSIDAISGFFQKKRINKNEKIMLLNDQELIVYILNKKR